MDNNAKTNAVEFLIFSCLKIKPNSKKEEIIELAIARAFRDAASHVLSVKDKYKESIKSKCVTSIKSFLNELNDKTDIDYDKKHEELCDFIVNQYDEEDNNNKIYKKDKKGNFRKMSYGIAQKWVNMSIKYIYILCVLDKYNGFFNDHFIDYVSLFHVPLDHYMLDKIENELKIDSNNYDIKTWSSINKYKNYLDYQKIIRNSTPTNYRNAFEWECYSWINH